MDRRENDDVIFPYFDENRRPARPSFLTDVMLPIWLMILAIVALVHASSGLPEAARAVREAINILFR